MADGTNKSSSSKGEAVEKTKGGLSGIAKLFNRPRPKTEYIGNVDEEIVINSQPSDLIFLKKCERCKVSLKKRAAKVIIESCTDLHVEMEEMVMSGTVELIDCRAIILKVNSLKPLPTLSAERCHDLQLFFYEPTAMESIYTVQCSDVKVHFQPPHTMVNEVFLPRDDRKQYVTKYEDGLLNTVMVLRGEGGYLTVEEEFWTAKEKKTQLQQFFEANLRGGGEGGDGVGESGGGQPFSSNITAEDEKKEFFDSEEELSKKLDLAAEWLKNSKHAIIFTGAGISTSCGIPDYRSGMDTVLKTGPGVWELAAHETERPEGASVTPIINALPSPTHMAIVQLHKERKVVLTISQNIDGLHRRSGLRRAQLAELHGNTNLETCEKCGRQYLRDFETRSAAPPPTPA